MQCDVFVLCDAATDSHSKLNILGTFDTIVAPEAPVTHPPCAVAIRLRFTRSEAGFHRIRVSFADEDGGLVLPSFEADIEIELPDGYDSVAQNMVLAIDPMEFDRFGDYSIDLAVNGELVGSLPLAVRQSDEL